MENISSKSNKYPITTDNLFATPKSKLLQLPDYIIENYIFPFLTGRDLFFHVRGVHPYLHDIVKSSWGNSIKEEMSIQLKNLTYIYEKDALTGVYEFKLQHLINYRNLLMLYNVNADILEVLQKAIDFIENENVFKLVQIFLVIIEQNNLLHFYNDNSIDIDSKKLAIIETLKTDEVINKYKNVISSIFEINNNNIEEESIKFQLLTQSFHEIDNQDIENINANCRLLFSFTQGLFEFHFLKHDVKMLKLKVDELFQRIQIENELWPKRRKFFESAYKILFYSRSTGNKFNFVNNLYIYYSIKSPLNEFKEEAYALMVNLRNIMEEKKIKIIQRMKENNNNNENNTDNIMSDVNEILLQNILDRRLLLTKKIIITERFFDVFIGINIFDYKDIFDNNGICDLRGAKISIEYFLKCLLLSGHTNPNEINVSTICHIYLLFRKNLEEDKNLFVITDEQKKLENQISPENKKEIEYLKKQKEDLVKQKQKAEQMLNVLKKFVISKQDYLKYENKYKPLLFVLNKINFEEGEKITTNRIEELLESKVENIEFSEEEIKDNEWGNIENFKINEELLKNIENSLMKRVNDFFQEEKTITRKILTERNFDENLKENKEDEKNNENDFKENNNDDNEKENNMNANIDKNKRGEK